MIMIEPLAVKHIEDAAALFVAAYKAQRRRFGYLPAEYEQTDAVAALLRDMLNAQAGVAAIVDRRLAGYLTGYSRIPNLKGLSQGVYVPDWGHAVAVGDSVERVFQPMYDAMSRDWVSGGNFTHAITFWANDTPLRDLLYWNGFGLLGIDAVRSTQQSLEDNVPQISGVTVRRAQRADLPELFRLDRELRCYMAQAPIFLAHEPSNEQEMAEAFLGQVTFSAVAEREGRLVGCIRGKLRKEDSCTSVQGESMMGIDFGYTAPEVRRTGVGEQLLAQVLAWGRERGKAGCAVDFESANVLGRHFWLKHFGALCFSAIRFVDPRVHHQ
ncbi:MAG: GNAT family N-acetyltransferase [Anaerolineae bacterium]|nr:GNAT family N-acetyltransferase [Anaerolineae bacterium]